MSINYNTSIPTGHLQLLLDASNRRSYNGKRSLINWDSWTAGSGGASGYGANGSTVENERLSAADPWGYNNIVWETRPTGTTDADGGWNTDWINIDRSKLYRFSVWVRRTSSTTGGTFYFGMYANGDGSRRTDNSAVEGNAYWDCRNISWMTQNQWYLVVGHVYPYNTTYTGRHPDSGTYTTTGRFGDVNGCNIGSGDLKWSANSTQGLHRTYHYYCPDATSRLQFYQPRIDLIDGTEPTIDDLLKNAESTWYDVSGYNRHFTWQTTPVFTRSSNASYFSTVDRRATGPASNSFNVNNGTGYTIFMISTTDVDNSNGAFKFYNTNGKNGSSTSRGIFLHPGWSNYTMYFDQSTCCNADQRTQYTFTLSDMRNFRVWTFRSRLYDRSIFMNGVNYINNTTYAGNINLGSATADISNVDEYASWNGKLLYFSMYNTGLDDSTVLSISNSLRGRFGI
jgi:hypothetical protein